MDAPHASDDEISSKFFVGFQHHPSYNGSTNPEVLSDTESNNASYVAPDRQGLEPTEPGFDDNTVDNDAGADWEPTENPKSMVIPGQMRSDRENVPAGFIKEEADLAEIQEAQEQATARGAELQAFATVTPTDCRAYWPFTLSVKTDNATRNKAASWAEGKIGKGYNKNFALTMIGYLDRDSYNSSQLVWAAYKHASGGGLDTGERYPYERYQAGVYPMDILLSHRTRAFS